MTTDTRKQAILAALRGFIAQRPGMDPRNYSDAKSYRQEYREVLRDKHDAERLLWHVENSMGPQGITADDILREVGGGGRLTIETEPVWNKGTPMPLDYTCGCGLYVHQEHRKAGGIHIADCHYARPYAEVSYCTGQYFPTEYRKAVARLAAAVLWAHAREHLMPPPLSCEGDRMYSGWEPGHKSPTAMSAGDWLRAHFKREFGRHLAERYFT